MPIRNAFATASLLGVCLGLLTCDVQAEVYKCSDASGHITYQQSPCSGAHRGGPVELLLDNGSGQAAPEVEARWRTAASQHEVVAGMPKRWVREALGPPADVRRGAPGDQAGEVWTWRTPVATVRVGFIGDAVTWRRSEANAGDAAPAATTAGDGPDAVRSRVALDRSCDETLAELGNADRQETVRVPGPGGRSQADATRYVYEAVAGSLPVRLAFTCVNGLVRDVTRDVAR
jgi:hypothetical protein